MVSVAESGMEEIPLREEESPEYRILMAYAQRTLPASKFTRLAETLTGTGTSNGQEGKTATSNRQEGKTARLLSHKELKTKKTRKKSLSKRLIPKCLRPQTDDKDHPYLKAVTPPEERWAQAMARRVQGIMKRSIMKRSIKMEGPEGQSGYRMFRRVSSVEADSDNEDELIAQIVQILRSSGDQLNEKIQQDQTLQAKMQSFWSYSFFSKITEHFLTDAVGQSEPEKEESEQQQVDRIALCMHTTTALSALECQPMNRVLGFGVRYLRENYSSWIQSHGGLEKVMEAQDGEEVE